MARSHRCGFLRLIIPICCLLAGCGGGGGGQPSRITVSVSPSSLTLSPNAGADFTCVVSGSSNTGVTWSVLEGLPGGTVSSTGRYVAPAVAGTYHVVATSKADPARSGQATITVPLTLSVDPTTATVSILESRQFTATIRGASNPTLHWSVQEGASGGTVTQAGVYTAPNAPGTYHVRVTSQATPVQTATITVTVVAGGASGTIE